MDNFSELTKEAIAEGDGLGSAMRKAAAIAAKEAVESLSSRRRSEPSLAMPNTTWRARTRAIPGTVPTNARSKPRSAP